MVMISTGMSLSLNPAYDDADDAEDVDDDEDVDEDQDVDDEDHEDEEGEESQNCATPVELGLQRVQLSHASKRLTSVFLPCAAPPNAPSYQQTPSVSGIYPTVCLLP